MSAFENDLPEGLDDVEEMDEIEEIESFFNEGVQSRLMSQKSYANVFYNWQLRSFQWEQFLVSLLDEPRELPKANAGFFQYKP